MTLNGIKRNSRVMYNGTIGLLAYEQCNCGVDCQLMVWVFLSNNPNHSDWDGGVKNMYGFKHCMEIENYNEYLTPMTLPEPIKHITKHKLCLG